MFDSMIMRFGLQSLAIKTLIQMSNGLNVEQRNNPFAHMLNKMMGMATPPLRLDEIQVVLRSHIFFKMVQRQWIEKVRVNHKYLEITKDMESNLKTGGDCSIFFILEELQKAFKEDKDIQEKILTSIKPDILRKNTENRVDLELKYSILKITNKIAKMGKDSKSVFKLLDRDKNGVCKYIPICLCC